MAVIIALTVAFIPWVKALFVTTANTPHISQAPDNAPPLSFSWILQVMSVPHVFHLG